MPKKIGTEMWRRKRQQGYLEMKEYRYYIFCEGLQTEPLYFQGFKRLIEENSSGDSASSVCRVLYFSPDGDLSDLLLLEK